MIRVEEMKNGTIKVYSDKGFLIENSKDQSTDYQYLIVNVKELSNFKEIQKEA